AWLAATVTPDPLTVSVYPSGPRLAGPLSRNAMPLSANGPRRKAEVTTGRGKPVARRSSVASWPAMPLAAEEPDWANRAVVAVTLYGVVAEVTETGAGTTSAMLGICGKPLAVAAWPEALRATVAEPASTMPAVSTANRRL